MKKRTFRAKRRTYRRRRRPGGIRRSSRYARRQQRSSAAFVRKKYTATFSFAVPANVDTSSICISLISGKNQQAPEQTITLSSCNQNANLSSDQRLYQFFKIRGCAFKMFFANTSQPETTPIQWSMAYSPSQIFNPNVAPATLQGLSSYQTGPCNFNTGISRFFNTQKTLKRFGIGWANSNELGNFEDAVPNYGG